MLPTYSWKKVGGLKPPPPAPSSARSLISAQILHERKTKWRVAPKRKTGVAAKHLLKKTADCTALQSQIDWTIEPWNHWTKNLKSLKNMVCCRLMPGSNKHCPFICKKKPRLFHFEGSQRRKILKDFINYCSWWSSAFHCDHFSFYLVINLFYVYVIFSFYVTPSM